jgi:hypothetical protein
MITRSSIVLFGILVAAAFATALAGCAEKTDRLTTAQRQKVMGWVSKSKTAPENPLNIKFGDKATLIGYDVSTDKAEPGKGLTITWHWQVDKAFGEGWRLFTHLADAADVNRINLDMNGLIRQSYQPSAWEEGRYIRDPQTLIVPTNWESNKLIFYMGFWKGSDRLKIENGPHDGSGRARAVSLDVSLAPMTLPEAHAARSDKPIKLDGKLDEPAWQRAVPTGAFVNTMNGKNAEPTVKAQLAWDANNLYVAFDVADTYLKSEFTKNDEHLWEQDCVEIMVDPDGDEKNYFEMQVSPANKRFDTHYDARRDPLPFGHTDWDSLLTSAVALRGTLNDDDADEGYTVEIAIPWKAFAGHQPKHTAPKAGDRWRINFFVMDARDKGTRAVGWSAPRVGDFHTLARFGTVAFDDVGGATASVDKTAPAAEAPASKGEALPTSETSKTAATAAGEKSGSKKDALEKPSAKAAEGASKVN